MTAAAATLAHLRLDRTTVILSLGSAAPMVLPPNHGTHAVRTLTHDEKQERTRTLAENETLIFALAVCEEPPCLIAALLGCDEESIHKRLRAHGLSRPRTGPNTWARKNAGAALVAFRWGKS